MPVIQAHIDVAGEDGPINRAMGSSDEELLKVIHTATGLRATGLVSRTRNHIVVIVTTNPEEIRSRDR